MATGGAVIGTVAETAVMIGTEEAMIGVMVGIVVDGLNQADMITIMDTDMAADVMIKDFYCV